MSSVNTNSNIISTVLDRLQNLEPDKYIIAFGPNGKQFIGTPNGYSAQVILAYMADCLTDYVTSTHLPSRPLAELSGCDIKRILWASFGEKPESWFFAYEFDNGAISLRLGEDAPDALHNYIDRISTSKLLLRSLRVQLGQDGSFVVWSRTAWACCNVPELLCIQLCFLSSTSRDYNGVTKGSLKNGSITNVQWHEDGSFFLRSSDYCRWAFRTAIMRGAWRNLWQDFENGKPGPEHMAELAVSNQTYWGQRQYLNHHSMLLSTHTQPLARRLLS
jgi:methylenetetrahydrofolate dehydrogenase (NADP+)/methenyltetrahydrofolate cyclohydrolase/formyltetrahydrofolate synthetase